MSKKSSKLSSDFWNHNPCGSYEELKNYICSASELRQIFNIKLLQQSWQNDVIPYRLYQNKKILEIGVGVGFDLLRFSLYGAKCYGIDVTDRHIDNTLATFNCFSQHCDVRKEDISCKISTFESSSFDLIYSFGVIHHIENRLLFYREISRLLKPDGKIIFVTYNLLSLATLSLYFHSLFNLNLFRFGFRKVHSTIEAGVKIDSNSLPHVELHSKYFWINEFRSNNLRVLSSSTHQLYFSRLGKFNRLLRPFERYLGWYNLFMLSK